MVMIKVEGNSIYLGVYGEDIGTRTDIMGNGEAKYWKN